MKKWPENGTLLRFLGKNGYDAQLARAKEALREGETYVCSGCEVGDWSHSVTLHSFGGERFNGVMFEIVEPAQ